MSWENVTIKVNGQEFEATMNGNELFVPMMVDEDVPSIEINGSSAEVESIRVDDRDQVVYITVKQANAKPKRKSNDKPVEGRDDDNAGEKAV